MPGLRSNRTDDNAPHAASLSQAVAAMSLTHAPCSQPAKPAAPTPGTHAASISSTPATTSADASGQTPRPNTPSGSGTHGQPAVTAPTTPYAPLASITASDLMAWEWVQAIRDEKGLHDAETVLVLLQYSAQLTAAGERDQAVTVLQAALKESMTTLGCNHTTTTQLSRARAPALAAAGQHEAALRQYRWVTPRVKAAYGEQSQEAVGVLLGTALCLQLERHSETQPVGKGAYEFAVQLWGSTYHDTLPTLRAYLAGCFTTYTIPPPAVTQRAQQHIEQCKRIHGRLDELAVDLGLALCRCYDLGSTQHTTTYKLLPELVAAGEALWGDQHPKYLDILSYRALNAGLCNKGSQAISLLLNLLHTRRRVQGEQHCNTVCCAADLALVYIKEGRHTDALHVYKTVWTAAKAALSPDHHYVRVLQDTHRLGKARALLEEAAAWGIGAGDLLQREAAAWEVGAGDLLQWEAAAWGVGAGDLLQWEAARSAAIQNT